MCPLLVIGSKNYSSWSLRPWLFLRKVAFDFEEHVIQFDADDYQAQIARYSPTGRVPLLIDGDLKIWDSLAICEYGAEVTGRGMPRERGARALSRSAAAEMHSGFAALRNDFPMNVRAKDRRVALSPQLRAEISRIDQLWSECRARFGSGGSWLFGDFSIADAMFSPVWFRFQTYGADLLPDSAAYLEHALKDSMLLDWQRASVEEGHPLAAVDQVGIA